MPTTHTFHIAGVQFRPDYRLALKAYADERLVLPRAVDLVREADNQYDANAIKVVLLTTHLGYIPKKFATGGNAEIAQHLDSGGDYSARLVQIEPEDKPHFMFKVELTLTQPEENEEHGMN